MTGYLILGAGKFGALALTRLKSQGRPAAFTIVETDPARQAAIQTAGGQEADVQWVQEEAIHFLARNLTGASPWDWIVPMVPGHVAAAWLLNGPLSGAGWEMVPVPEEFDSLAPVTVRGPRGEVYLSRARHQCLDDCAEPALCPVSGETREPPLYQELAEYEGDAGRMMVIATTQLAPGVGGYPPARLFQLAQAAAAAKGRLLVATACRCHGVVHMLARRPKVPYV